MRPCVSSKEWVAKVKKSIDDKTQAGWLKTLTERWRGLLAGDDPCVSSEQAELEYRRTLKLKPTPREYAEKDRDELLTRFAEKLDNASQFGRPRPFPRRVTVDEITLDIRPTSFCYVDYMGKEKEIVVEGAKGIVGTVTLHFGRGHSTTVSVYHRYIGKTFHQYVGLASDSE